MKNSAELILDVGQKDAQDLIAALKKENASQKRFSSEIFMREGRLIIRVEAEDMVAMRSTLNSYLRYLSTMEEFDDKFGAEGEQV